MSKPVAVLISDVHYSLPTLALADAALRQAIKKANELGVQLWIAGDLHDTKANLRAECLNALTKTLMLAHKRPRVLIGNHDKINEKSDDHALNILDGLYAQIIDKPVHTTNGTYFIPYHHDTAALAAYLNGVPAHSLLIMHQGIHGSNMGDYVMDKSAISPELVAGHRVISGHYHARQTITLPNGGVWDYIGNPYTVSYGEANDPEKGFQILMDDGTIEFVPTNLRSHRVWVSDTNFETPLKYNEGDLLWAKITGTKEQLAGCSKAMVSTILGVTDFRLDLIPEDTTTTAPTKAPTLAAPDLIDSLIDSLTSTSDERKLRLKDIWRSL